MRTTDILSMPITHLACAVQDGTVRAIDVADAFLQQARVCDPNVHAFVHLNEAGVQRQAEAVDRKRCRGEQLGPLAGVPVAIKDSICTIDAPTTCGSHALQRDGLGWCSPYDATVVSRLRHADAIIFGKTNLDEFAMGSSTQASAFGGTRNPVCAGCVPGGSSGGSAAAVASRMVPAALGSDTGGSIRQPAAFASIVGIRPTYGRVSRRGLVAFASSLDQLGPMARDVRGAARLFDVIAGWDEGDATSILSPGGEVESSCGKRVEGLRLGVPVECFAEDLDPVVARCVRRALDGLVGKGCELESICLPTMRLAMAAYCVISSAEASSNLARFDGVRFGATVDRCCDADTLRAITRGTGFGMEVKRRILLGAYVLSAGSHGGRDGSYHERACLVRTRMTEDLAKAFSVVDAIVTPTSPVVPWPVAENRGDPLASAYADVFTVPASLAGIPALSVPCGHTAEGKPVGLQLMGPKGSENLLCRIASAWEQVRDAHAVEL